MGTCWKFSCACSWYCVGKCGISFVFVSSLLLRKEVKTFLLMPLLAFTTSTLSSKLSQLCFSSVALANRFASSLNTARVRLAGVRGKQEGT